MKFNKRKIFGLKYTFPTFTAETDTKKKIKAYLESKQIKRLRRTKESKNRQTEQQTGENTDTNSLR
jgi:hypothetical protein